MGRTVAGPDDPRLGKIDVLLVSHMHGYHVGDGHQPKPGAGTCGKPDISVKAVPNTNTVNIAMKKLATIVVGSEMRKFFQSRLKALGGDPKKAQLVRFGSSRKFGGVMITTVPAVHSNGVNPAMIGGDLGKMLAVINIGNVFNTGPMQAAFVINKLVQPNSVIVSHANGVATKGGAMIGGTKTEQSIKATKAPVHVPLSGRTLAFNGWGKCVSGF